MPRDKIYDGFTQVIGQDSGTDPMFLEPQFMARAVNRSFRGGMNKTRPPFKELNVTYESDAVKKLIEEGNVQGVHAYRKTSSVHSPGLLVAAGGSVFFGRIYANNIEFTKIYEGNDPLLMHTWFAQGEEMVYWQNGSDLPGTWDGQLAQGRTIEGDNKMPIGTIMAYAHGRIFLSDAKNRISASDHLYGQGFSRRNNMENFTESSESLDGGFFFTPTLLGEITGMTVMRNAGTGALIGQGQGELVIFCDNGAMTIGALDFTRGTWKQSTSYVGAGCVSPWSVVAVNNDIWFRRPDGIGSYRQARLDETREWGDTPLSKEVRYFIEGDTSHLTQFTSAAYFDNQLFMTCSPRRAQGTDWGDHRFGAGMVVLDFDRGSTVNPFPGFGWHGMWTGVRPTHLARMTIEGRDRLFVPSYDRDGINRFYEMLPHETGLYEDPGQKRIKSFFMTPALSKFGKSSSFFDPKQLVGGGRTRFVVKGEGDVSVKFRADHYPCWSDMLPQKKIGLKNCLDADTVANHGCNPRAFPEVYKDLALPSPDETICKESISAPVDRGTSFQFLYELEGAITVPWSRIAAVADPDNEVAECEDSQDYTEPIQCCPKDNFEYYIK